MARMHGAGAGTISAWQVIKSRCCCILHFYLLLHFGYLCPANIIWRSTGMGWGGGITTRFCLVVFMCSVCMCLKQIKQ